jgi:hypothetical protein
VEVVERARFDLVGVLMAFAVVAAQPEELVAACGANREDNREVQDVQTVLPRNQAEFDAGGARKGELRFAVPGFSRSFSFLRYSSGNRLRSASSSWISESV